MKSDSDIALTLLVNMSLISFLAVGGANSVMPEIHRQVVDLHAWVGDRQFSELFAIASASPGPNVVFVTLLGYHVAGLTGALAATFGLIAPTCVLTYVMSRLFDHFKEAAWRNTVQTALVSVTIGLIAAGALIIARAADHDWKTLVVTMASFAITYWTRVSLLVPLGIAAVLGIVGIL